MAIDPITQHILEQQNINEQMDEDTFRHVVKFGGRLAILLAVIYFAYRQKKKQGAAICNEKEGEEKEACLQAYKIGALDNQLKVARKVNTLCHKSEDPKKCRERISSEVSKIKQRLKKDKSRLKQLKR